MSILWTPEDIATKLWIDASDETTITEAGGVISQWDDKSGNDAHLEATGAPFVSALTQNGLSLVEFDGSNDWFSTLFQVDLSAATTLVVVRRHTQLTYERSYLNIDPGDVLCPFQMYLSSEGLAADWRTGASAGPVSAGQMFVSSHVVDSSINVSMFVDGTIGTVGTSSTQFAGSRTLHFGRYQTFGSLNRMEGELAEVILVDGSDSALREKLEGYIAHKWGLDSELPVDHPYKTEAPVGSITLLLSSPSPAGGIKVYGTSQTLSIVATVSGGGVPSYYNADFYNIDDVQIGSTISGIQSGYPATTPFSTLSGTNYLWYTVVTVSGVEETSPTYNFHVRYLCSGICNVTGQPASGIKVNLHKRDSGQLIGTTTTAGTGVFGIDSTYNEQHYVVALHEDQELNAIIFDKIIPD